MKLSDEIPESVEVAIANGTISIKGPLGELTRRYPMRSVDINRKENVIIVSSKFKNAKVRALEGTFRAHINNMIKGVQAPFVYKLKVTSVHFPMTVTLSADTLSVTNFLGGKKPRTLKVPANVKITIEGSNITVESIDIESAGNIATRIEQLTRVKKRDTRVFQDGIYITHKAGEPLKQ